MQTMSKFSELMLALCGNSYVIYSRTSDLIMFMCISTTYVLMPICPSDAFVEGPKLSIYISPMYFICLIAYQRGQLAKDQAFYLNIIRNECICKLR